jgi:Ca2+/Na+ antiporter
MFFKIGIICIFPSKAQTYVLLLITFYLLFKFQLIWWTMSFIGSVGVFYLYIIYIVRAAKLDNWWDHGAKVRKHTPKNNSLYLEFKLIKRY